MTSPAASGPPKTQDSRTEESCHPIEISSQRNTGANTHNNWLFRVPMLPWLPLVFVMLIKYFYFRFNDLDCHPPSHKFSRPHPKRPCVDPAPGPGVGSGALGGPAWNRTSGSLELDLVERTEDFEPFVALWDTKIISSYQWTFWGCYLMLFICSYIFVSQQYFRSAKNDGCQVMHHCVERGLTTGCRPCNNKLE